jgi:hypothetical protein
VFKGFRAVEFKGCGRGVDSRERVAGVCGSRRECVCQG